MKDVTTTYFPDCDLSSTHVDGAPRLGRYNAPTHGGPWANLCDECMKLHGIDTSVTERRVHPDHPFEVLAIARLWGGSDAEVVAMSGRSGAWLFQEAHEGDRYSVYRPGEPFPVYEDSGRPCGTVTRDEWLVRALNDAPDCWFGVSTDGRNTSFSGEERVVW